MLALPLAAQSTGNNEDGKAIDKEKLEAKDYLPEVHGTIRSKYEYQTEMGAGRFEVRNARISLTGNILPSVAYKAEIDLSDEGEIKMLDAYARIFPLKGLTVTAGQMRVPFTIDAHRSPHQQYFANRSFIAKQVGNVRDVGLTLGYKLPTDMPVTIEGGLYNGTGLTNQKVWHKEVNYSAKAAMFLTQGLNLTLSVQAIQPEDIRMQSYDIGAYYEFGRFHIEGEYLYKTYSKNAFDDVQAVVHRVGCSHAEQLRPRRQRAEREVGRQVEVGHEARQIPCRIGHVHVHHPLQQPVDAVVDGRGRDAHEGKAHELIPHVPWRSSHASCVSCRVG